MGIKVSSISQRLQITLCNENIEKRTVDVNHELATAWLAMLCSISTMCGNKYQENLKAVCQKLD